MLYASECYLVRNTDHEAVRYIVFLAPKYLPHHRILEYPPPMFLPQCERADSPKTTKIRLVFILAPLNSSAVLY